MKKNTVDLKSLYRRYYDAEPITDQELIVGTKHFRELADLLRKSGPEFSIAFKEAIQLSIRLEDMGNARKLKMDDTPVVTSDSPSM